MTEDERQLIDEREHYWRSIKLVQLGETFPLFDTTRNRTQIRYSDNGMFGGMKSSIRLETGFLGKLNISVAAAPYAKERYSVLTPFDREQGYPLDRDDLSFHSRVVKTGKMKHERAEVIQGLYLFVFVTYEDTLLNGMLQALLQENGQLQGSDRTSVFRHLFLTVKFPHGSGFTARASFNARQRLLLFDSFFPSDTGPLPKIGAAAATPPKAAGGRGGIQNTHGEQEGDKSEGFAILLPFDLAKLQTIQAQFLFLPDLD